MHDLSHQPAFFSAREKLAQALLRILVVRLVAPVVVVVVSRTGRSFGRLRSVEFKRMEPLPPAALLTGAAALTRGAHVRKLHCGLHGFL